MTIQYSTDKTITREQFRDILNRSTLGERRPVNDDRCLDAMLHHGNLLCTAWDAEKLVGVARSLTDFSFCCYLSDLAVDTAYQHQGIGIELVRRTQQMLGDQAKLILLSAPKATAYYPKIGFDRHDSAWIIGSRTELKGHCN